MALAERPTEPWRSIDWQKLWLTVRSSPWRSLALVPAGSGAPRDFTLRVAVWLARTGMMHLGIPIRVADATQVPLTQMMQLNEEVSSYTSSGDLVLIALPAASESAITTSIAQGSDCALLCVLLEKMATADAKKTIRQIGTRKFIGSVLFHPTEKL